MQPIASANRRRIVRHVAAQERSSFKGLEISTNYSRCHRLLKLLRFMPFTTLRTDKSRTIPTVHSC